MSSNQLNRPTIQLNSEDRERLEQFAPLFDVHVHPSNEDEVILQVLDRGGWRESTILKERLHIRLLTELCSKTIRWVFYPIGKPCSDALLGLEDLRINRIAELYSQQKITLLELSPSQLERPEIALV